MYVKMGVRVALSMINTKIVITHFVYLKLSTFGLDMFESLGTLSRLVNPDFEISLHFESSWLVFNFFKFPGKKISFHITCKSLQLWYIK